MAERIGLRGRGRGTPMLVGFLRALGGLAALVAAFFSLVFLIGVFSTDPPATPSTPQARAPATEPDDPPHACRASLAITAARGSGDIGEIDFEAANTGTAAWQAARVDCVGYDAGGNPFAEGIDVFTSEIPPGKTWRGRATVMKNREEPLAAIECRLRPSAGLERCEEPVARRSRTPK